MSPVVWELAYEDKLTALHRHVSQLSLANGISEIVKFTLDAMEYALGFDVADITVVKDNCLRMAGYRGSPKPLIDAPLNGRGITVKAANTKALIRVRDTRKEPLYLDKRGFGWKGPPSMLSELAVPVIVDDEAIAVLNVESKQLSAFTASDEALLEILAFHVASAFKRLKYEEKLRRYSEGLEELIKERTRKLRENEQELRSTKERLEYIVSSNPAVIYSGKPLADLSDWELTYVSDRVTALLGYPPEMFVGHPEFWRQQVHPYDLQANPEIVQALWKTGHVTFDYQFQHKDGSYRWIKEEATATRDAAGNPVEVYGYWTDITALKQTEQALADSERRFREVADLIPSIVFEMDPEGKITFINKTGFKTVGYSENDLKNGMNVLQVISPGDHAVLWKRIKDVLNGQTSSGHEYTIVREDGSSFPAIVHTNPMMKEGKVVGLRSIVTDVTEHKRMEAQLAESSRLAAIGATTALVGHDLRNPLQGIAAAIHLLKTRSQASLPAHEEEAEQEEAELFDMIDDAVMYMDKIVSDLQNFAAPVHPEMASINTTEVLKETLSTMRIPSSLKVSINVSEGAEIMTADPVLVKRVFTNLITNAVQAMPRGGELKILARRDGDEHLISFHDTGVGIASETLPRLFEPFFTTKAIGQGLGLPVCKRLVEAHGGAITVDSILGNGSNFTVKLPASKGGG